jgi:predicted dehydrogenase
MNKNKSTKKRILFFGLGSIGKKHASFTKNKFNYDLYAYRTGKGQEKNNLNIKEFDNIDEAFSIKPDIAFITNPTFLHTETAIECAKRGISLFIEKPISNSLNGLDELEKEIKKRKLFTYVAYNLRFHPVINNLKEILPKKEKPIYFRVKSSSYLPSWRQKQDYSKSYSAKKEYGGGVILDLSHEFDYITWLFGNIKEINGYCDKISNLDIDSEDILEAQIICKSNISGNLHLDYFSREEERKIQIYYNDKYFEGDLIHNTIRIINDDGSEKKTYYHTNLDDTYDKQLEYFFEQYDGKKLDSMNNFSEAFLTFKKIMNFKKECYWELDR